MNNLKFRVRDKKLNKYVQSCTEEQYMIASDGSLWLGDDHDFYKIKDKDRFVIEQFTGLTDKNGKEIFEGDIVDHRYGKSIVRQDDERSGFNPFNGDINCPSAEYESEIIGNIHRNPELLEGTP